MHLWVEGKLQSDCALWVAGTETDVYASLFVVEWEMFGTVGLAFGALFGPLEIYVVVGL